MTGPATAECGHWLGELRLYCRAVVGVRRYRTGLRCPLHTPAALADRPEPPSGPGWPAAARTTYRAAQAAEENHKR
ncbi:hypothetical protein [Streptomyces sp. NPDC056987]|uniref:hypothetical protein n=1 Tax=Streptomyces sp. NPDC056987 TaxID=3345988 RepID=UPI00362A0FD8